MEAIHILGILAAICTTSAFLPQAVKVITTRDTKSLSLVMYVVLTIGVALWFIYGLLKSDYPLIIANGITFIFAATILFIKVKNKD